LQDQKQKSFYAKVGELIREVRIHHNVKQEVLAKYLRVTRVCVSNIEMGKQRVQLHTLVEIATYFNLPVQDLLATDLTQRELAARLEKKISVSGISNNAKAVANVTNFVNKYSTSNTASHVHTTPTPSKNRAKGRRTTSSMRD
jgi:DNA-binding XRE family transcriptional regulator